MQADEIDVPRRWEQLAVEQLGGMLLVVGAPDVGKSTFARYLYERLRAAGGRVAYLDGDPGQSSLGPPTTMTVAMGNLRVDGFPPLGEVYRSFVGAVTPRGHMLPLLVGAARLVQAAQGVGAQAIVYDTSGLIDPSKGGLTLKLSKVDLLRPAVVFAIQQRGELESLLVPLRRSQRVRVIDLHTAPAVARRGVSTRRAHRAAQFARYFCAARPLEVDWARLAILPAPRFDLHRLVAFEDINGFVLGLGIVLDHDRGARRVTFYTPLTCLDGVDALHLGNTVVDPQTFRDQGWFVPVS